VKDKGKTSDTLLAPDDPKGLEIIGQELTSATSTFKRDIPSSGDRSWETATEIVRNFRPVPYILWRMVNAVFGRHAVQKAMGPFGTPDHITFDPVQYLIINAAADKTLGGEQGAKDPPKSLEQAVKLLGADVTAALCVLHAVCRRISASLSERVWRPILDDALMRSQIGYHVGGFQSKFGKGRGMLAGFAGRSGLAVLIASGEVALAQRALEGLAAGMDIKDVGLKVYGCDPLQVAAMTLTAAGCSFDAGFGIASYSQGGAGAAPGGEQFLWYSAFSIAENTRMGKSELVDPRCWKALGYNESDKGTLKSQMQALQRRGPAWQWLVLPQSQSSG
jgi:hypothetical protein